MEPSILNEIREALVVERYSCYASLSIFIQFLFLSLQGPIWSVHAKYESAENIVCRHSTYTVTIVQR